MMKWTKSWAARLGLRGPSPEKLDAQRAQLVRRLPAPTIWMFGKTGSGKSSLIRLLTGAAGVEIGRGFRPTTRHTQLYSFPDPDMPVVHFLDTRGLGEPGYDAAEDIAQLERQADALIVTQRILDFATEAVVEPLKIIRSATPQRPVLLALTCLHEAYPQQQHPPYPFGESGESLEAEGLNEDLARALAQQQRRFAGLFDVVVPLDITPPDEGFQPPDYGGVQFLDTLTGLLPSTYQYALQGMSEIRRELGDLHEQAALPYIHSSALLAATAALAPVPWVDIPVVAAIQTRMVYAVARIYQQRSSVQQTIEMLAAAGIGFAARLGVRELLKLIPYIGTVAGGVLGAAMAYSYTYAMGRVCCWYYRRVHAGHEPTKAEIRQVFRDHWDEGKAIWNSMRQAHS
jgi:uncharacterized protein (DUF697 family)